MVYYTLKEINIKNLTCYFFDDIIYIKSVDPKKIIIDEKLHHNILIYYIEYMTVKNLSYVKLIMDKTNGYI